MSGQTAKAEVKFDCAIRGFERKLEGPTVSLIERVLDEAGLDGQWTLRDSRRIRKKGRGRFATIRLESRGGAKSVRIWCKPKGNDTGFEYSLYPPLEADIDFAFKVLSRVHPVTLIIPESRSLPGAVMDRILNIPAPIRAASPSPIFEVEEEAKSQEQEAVDVEKETSESESDDHELDGALEESWVSFSEQGGEEHKSSEEHPVLAIEDEADLWDRDVADRALMAIAFVAEGGFARKSEASNSIVRHLGMERFSGGGSDRYKSLQGSMRALTMAIAKKWRYIERVKYSAEHGGGSSDTVKGYKITAKGQRRLEAVKDSFGERARFLLEGRGVRQDEPVSTEGLTARSAGGSVASISMETIKGMVERHEEAKRQIREHDEVLQALDTELRSLGIEFDGLSAVESDRKKKMAELQLEIDEIESKKSAMNEKLAKKREERRQWAEMKAPHVLECDRIESILTRRGEA